MKRYLYKFFSLIDLRSASFFLSVGACSAIVYFLSFAFLWKYLDLNYKVAVSIAYILSIIVHFTGNRQLTFRHQKHRLSYQLIKYLIMIAINYVITLMVVHVVVSELALSPYFGVICAIALTVGTGYLMAKFWVFRKGESVARPFS